LLIGKELGDFFAGGVHEISGFIEELERHGIEPVPIFRAGTWPSGIITRETCEQLMQMMFDEVDKAGPMDGYLVAPHGANAGEDEYSDLDGYWLARLRQKAGPDVPIIAVMDPHANLSAKMIAATNASIAYRTNPHLDQKQRGLEAAGLMVRTLRGEIKPTQAASFPPIQINIERQNTDEPHCQQLYALADELRQEPGVLSNGVVLGFPYTDVVEMGTAFITVTDNDPALAQRHADRMAQYLIEHRHEFVGQYITVEEAVDRALSLPGPVGLLDMGDNVGGGSAADGTLIAHELHRRAAAPAFVCIYDPEAARQAMEAGPGKRLHLTIGGKTDDKHGPPLEVDVTVHGTSDGRFHESGVMHGGQSDYDIGPVVTVETDSKLTINLTERRVVPVSIGHMTCCGLDPASFKVIVGKGVHSPVPALRPYCQTLIRVNTPGATSADLSHFDYKNRRHPLFPFEEIG
jgi:microcystin degradation protein MlrC